MMLRKWNLIILMWGIVQLSWAGPLTEETLARRIQPHSQLTHFKQMRFYPPSNRLYTTPGIWDRWVNLDIPREHERALAFYLYNMAVLKNTRRLENTPLSLNELGVLDAFVLCHQPFDFKHASSFLKAHQAQVDEWLATFIKKRPLPGKNPTRQEYQAWAVLLEKLPLYKGQAAYAMPDVLHLQAPVSAPLSQHLSTFLQQARELGKTQVVLYDKPDLKLEDMDHKIGNTRVYRKRTYRWVTQECYFMSYLAGRYLVQEFTEHRPVWKDLRVYLVTASPATGEFLKPAQGTRFGLFDRTTGSHWRYHTAVLVVAREGEYYVPVVLDSLLGGTAPMTFGQWVKSFDKGTLFTAAPFLRDETVEQAFQTPDTQETEDIWVDGKKYTPAPVLY